jgi:hypothetical protein
MAFEMLRWWYTAGWMQTLRRITEWPLGIERSFSFFILIQTLFSPWRRIISVGGKTIDDRFRAAMDNLVSRVIGFVVRSAVLLFALFAMAGAALAAVVAAAAWPLLPLTVVYGIVRGIIG